MITDEQIEKIVKLVVEEKLWLFFATPLGKKDGTPHAVVVGDEQGVKEYESMYLGPGEIWEPSEEAK